MQPVLAKQSIKIGSLKKGDVLLTKPTGDQPTFFRVQSEQAARTDPQALPPGFAKHCLVNSDQLVTLYRRTWTTTAPGDIENDGR